MTTVSIPDDIRADEVRLGHEDLLPDTDSYVPAWRCTACKGGLLLADLSWQGWAIEHTCEAVQALRSRTT